MNARINYLLETRRDNDTSVGLMKRREMNGNESRDVGVNVRMNYYLK